MVEGVDYASSSVGNLISGPLFISVGYYGVFGIGALLNLFGLVYIGAFLKESVIPSSQSEQKQSREKTTDEESNGIHFSTIIKRSFLYILEGVRTVIKPRAGLRRSFIFLGLFSYMCYYSIICGTEGSTMIYFGNDRVMDDTLINV